MGQEQRTMLHCKTGGANHSSLMPFLGPATFANRACLMYGASLLFFQARRSASGAIPAIAAVPFPFPGSVRTAGNKWRGAAIVRPYSVTGGRGLRATVEPPNLKCSQLEGKDEMKCSACDGGQRRDRRHTRLFRLVKARSKTLEWSESGAFGLWDQRRAGTAESFSGFNDVS